MGPLTAWPHDWHYGVELEELWKVTDTITRGRDTARSSSLLIINEKVWRSPRQAWKDDRPGSIKEGRTGDCGNRWPPSKLPAGVCLCT